MKHRMLRIAWSAGCGVLCLLIALWVRSYEVNDRSVARVSPTRAIGVESLFGAVKITWMDLERLQLSLPSFIYRSNQIGPWGDDLEWPNWRTLGFYGTRDRTGSIIIIPYWALIGLTCLAASLPALRWRFSLRTLLIGMTVVAVLLAVVIYMAK